MIRVSVFYPNEANKRFDMDYYRDRHMAMVQEKLGAACKGVSVDQGLSAGQPGSEPAYVAVGHLLFDSLEEFQSAFGPHGQEIMADVPNYTDIEPVIQVSEVKLGV